MKAMIFAAGLGTRLQPLTNDRPKALVEIEGKPLLEIVLRRLINSGITDIVINVHHFAEKVIRFIEDNNNFGINIQISDERSQLLETGGGLKKAIPLLKGSVPILICNVDVITNIDFGKMLEFHKKSTAIATLAVRNRETSRYLLFNNKKNLCGWKNVKTGELKVARNTQKVPSQLAFSGVHIIEPTLFSYIKQEGKFSIIDVYLEVAKHKLIKGYMHDDDVWLDVGKPQNLATAKELLSFL